MCFVLLRWIVLLLLSEPSRANFKVVYIYWRLFSYHCTLQVFTVFFKFIRWCICCISPYLFPFYVRSHVCRLGIRHCCKIAFLFYCMDITIPMRSGEGWNMPHLHRIRVGLEQAKSLQDPRRVGTCHISTGTGKGWNIPRLKRIV